MWILLRNYGGGVYFIVGAGMAKEATAACGYGVKVIPKRAPITVDYTLYRGFVLPRPVCALSAGPSPW